MGNFLLSWEYVPLHFAKTTLVAFWNMYSLQGKPLTREQIENIQRVEQEILEIEERTYRMIKNRQDES